jgi:hypothetical protein
MNRILLIFVILLLLAAAAADLQRALFPLFPL